MRWLNDHKPLCACMVCIALLGAGTAWAGSLRIDTKSDWEKWSFPKGALLLTEDGQVQPRFFRKNINACLNADEFVWVDKKKKEHVGGVRNVGSNAAMAARIIDGDPNTSWGPQRSDDPENWWVEIDLGRMVTATKLILRFSEEADPFEEFKVYMSDGTPAFVSSAVPDAPRYQTVVNVTKSNREYVLEYPLRDAYNNEVLHRSVRYVYVLMTAWRDPDANPQLAELEVISLGDNVALATLKRGGSIAAYSTGGVGSALIDGDGTTFWASSRWGIFLEAHWWFHLDLGTRFWVDRIVLVAYPPSILASRVSPPIYHRVEVSDGTFQPGVAEGWEVKGPYVWNVVDEVSQNPPPGADRALYVLETQFAPRQVERIFYDHLAPHGIDPGRIRIREVQVFGEGTVPHITLRSEFIDLKKSSNITSIEWGADTPPGTGVEIRTRTGDEIIEEVHYYTADGHEVLDKNKNGTAQDEYNKLPPFRRGEIRPLVKAGKGWSGWSRPYLHSGDPFLSPSPRRYFQLEATLETKDPKAAASLDRITLFFTDPLAKSVVGEIWPVQAEAPAVPQDFSYFILPTFDFQSKGFDTVLIRTPSQAEFHLLKVGGDPVQPDSVRVGPDSLWIRLPLVRRQPHPLVEVRFRCPIFLNGTLFDAFLGHSSESDTWQRVDPGDASEEMDSQRIVVGVPVGNNLLDWATPPPSTITPNGDGQNDEMVFDFIVLKVNTPRPLCIRIYDLHGAVVRELLKESGSSDRYRVVWDGQNDAGERVFPGLYLVQICVEGAQKKATLNRIIAVVY